MLTILYPKEDYTSADIALRVQALAQSQNQKVYTVPKHYGRNSEAVFAKLSKSSAVLFIVHDQEQIDQDTQAELEFLLQKGKTIHAIVPESLKILPEAIKKHTYQDKSQFTDTLNEFTNSLKKKPHKSKKDTQNFALLILAGTLMIVILFLMLYNDKEKE